MDLSKMSNERKLHLCKWYFWLGFAFIPLWTVNSIWFFHEAYWEPTYFRTMRMAGVTLLPLMWIIYSIWFFNEAFRKPMYEEQELIKQYVIMSAANSSIWFIILGTWLRIFQLNRVYWGAYATHISFMSEFYNVLK